MQDQDSLDTTTPPPTTAPDHPTAMQRQIDPGFKALISTATSSNQTVAEQSQSASGVMAPIPTTDSASPTAMRDPAHTGATTLPPTLTPTHPATADENPPAYFPAVLPPVAEEAAGEHKDDPRDTQSSESNRIPTSGSAESPEVAPFSDSIPEASTISKTPATVLDNDEAAGPLQDFKSTAFRPEYNVYLRSNLGLRAGDIVMEKRRYLVVEDRFDRDIRAYPMTTFSDTNPNRVRDLTVKGDSLGLRYRVSDFVQNVAAHHPGGPVKPEARCFDDGKIMLHWSGPVDAPPPSKVSFVSLIPETIVISKYGVKLMGRCTNKSYNQLRDAAKRHSAKRDFATANTVQQQRIMDPDYQTSAYTAQPDIPASAPGQASKFNSALPRPQSARPITIPGCSAKVEAILDDPDTMAPQVNKLATPDTGLTEAMRGLGQPFVKRKIADSLNEPDVKASPVNKLAARDTGLTSAIGNLGTKDEEFEEENCSEKDPRKKRKL